MARLTKQEREMAAVADLLRPFGSPLPPGPGLGFTPEDDVLLERGWPHLRVLTNEDVEAPAARAEKALESLDPVLGLRVPRELAAAYLRGYAFGPSINANRRSREENRPVLAARRAAIESGVPVDRAQLDAMLESLCEGKIDDTYKHWRLPEVLYLYEAFLGADEVASAITSALIEVAGRARVSFGDSNSFNHPGHTLALTLPWLLRRAAPSVVTDLRAQLKAVAPQPRAKGGAKQYYALLHVLAEQGAPLPPELEVLDHRFMYINDDVPAVTTRLTAKPQFALRETRSVWLLGGKVLTCPVSLPDTKELQLAMLDELGILREPAAVRVIAHLAARRATQAAAAQWLNAHPSHARPILEALREGGSAKDAKAAAKALELLQDGQLDTPPASEAALEAEIARLFTELRSALEATSDRDAHIELIREAFEAYSEARAAAGDPTPEAYFTHSMGEHGLDGDWCMLAVDVMNGDV
ncbi:MAG: hypothetical protein KIT72_01960 [Polyangiaceae bacterium]|nr:hypothetical protein [Polyangiaceae bacterium]MCW5789163.1 hypothetical protein [Polyangiaceae bacterium]